MKRLAAMLALLAGGLATEAMHPLTCSLATFTRSEKIVPHGRRKSVLRGV